MFSGNSPVFTVQSAPLFMHCTLASMTRHRVLVQVSTAIFLCSLLIAPHTVVAFNAVPSRAPPGQQHRHTSVPRWTNVPPAKQQHVMPAASRRGHRCVDVSNMCILPSSSEAAAAAEVAAAEVTGEERAEGAVVTDPYVTELPDSFEDSIARMGKGTLQAMDEGHKLVRIDFDTSAGDETYTTLKSSLEMAKQLTKLLADNIIVGKEGATMTLFFPDAGSAALAKHEWKAGKEGAQVPEGVRFCTVKTEEPADTDVGCILLCPRNSEAEFALSLVRKVDALGQFMVLINPALINMDTTGYGLAGRQIRNEILSAFHVTYYLRTLSWGAVTKQYGKRYTVWQDDSDEPTGYRLLKTVVERPAGEELDDIYNIANGLMEEDETPEFLSTVAKFVRDFGKL